MRHYVVIHPFCLTRKEKNMALTVIENAVAVRHRGITVYHIHKDDTMEMGVREYSFSLDPYGSEGSDEAFDIRDICGYDETKSLAHNLVQMIQAESFGDITALESKDNDYYEPCKDEIKAGHCPVCSTEITEYGTADIMDEAIAYPFICKNCGISGSEWSKTIFDGYAVN